MSVTPTVWEMVAFGLASGSFSGAGWAKAAAAARKKMAKRGMMVLRSVAFTCPPEKPSRAKSEPAVERLAFHYAGISHGFRLGGA
jgi:hypothetical protein